MTRITIKKISLVVKSMYQENVSFEGQILTPSKRKEKKQPQQQKTTKNQKKTEKNQTKLSVSHLAQKTVDHF